MNRGHLVNSPQPLRFALDHNFPFAILQSMRDFIPEVTMTPVRRIDERLAELSDRHLFIVLDALGYDGLVTNNHKMVKIAREMAALHRTGLTLFAVRGCGGDPIRAAGAVLLDLPAATRKMVAGRPQVFLSSPRAPEPKRPWEYLTMIAQREERSASELFSEVRVDDEEHSAVLEAWWRPASR